MSPSNLARRAVDRLPPAAGQGVRDAVEIATNRSGRRRRLVREYAFRAAGRVTPSLTIRANGARFVLNTADKEVSRCLFVYGCYERPLMEEVFRVLSSVDGRPFGLADRLFLDIGANIGSATVEACVHFGAAGAVALEPDAESFGYLRRNLAANGLEGRVGAHRVAVSDRDGEVVLELCDFNPGDNRVRTGTPGGNAFGERDREVITVPARSLDSLVEEGAIDLERVGLAWIDVQAHEAEVLGGAESLTATDIPVVVEYWPYGLRSAGSLERLDSEVAAHYSHYVDTRESRTQDEPPAARPVSELGGLRELYPEPLDYTDLILLKR